MPSGGVTLIYLYIHRLGCIFGFKLFRLLFKGVLYGQVTEWEYLFL